MDPQARTEFVLMYELDGAQHEFPLTGQRLVIGRAKDCNLCFPLNTEVSRLHAALTSTPEGWKIEDMSSRSGTFVNGERPVGPRRLRDKDVLTIGAVTLTLRQKKHELETVTGDAGLPGDLLAEARAQAAARSPAPATSPDAPASRDRAGGVPWEQPASQPTPTSYYELIGVANFEADVAKIQAAAKRRLAQLRADSAPGSRAGRQAEVETIAGGLASLANPKKKQLYDSELAQELGTEVEVRGGRVVPVEPTSFGQILVGLILVGVVICIVWFGLSWLLKAIAPIFDISG